jgi:hypothetical protein
MTTDERVDQVRREMADICAAAVEKAITDARADERRVIAAWLRGNAGHWRLATDAVGAITARAIEELADQIERGDRS